MSIERELTAISNAMNEDLDLAWTWHCNLAMNIFDQGVDMLKASAASRQFMLNVFNVDVFHCPHWAEVMKCVTSTIEIKVETEERPIEL